MIRVVVIDDHPVFRQGLAQAVDSAQDMELLAALPSIEALDSSEQDLEGTLVLLDLGLPGRAGDAAVRDVANRGARVLVVSAQAARDAVVDAITAGAAGYVTKASEPGEITEAARVVAQGGTYVSPTLASFLLTEATDQRTSGFSLSERELEILRLVASGERDTDIAHDLYISVRTVHSHLDRIRDKTGRRRRADLTRLAFEEGLLHEDPQQ